MDRQPLCLACDYPLHDSAATRCPECGRAFDPADRATFNATGEPIGTVRRWLVCAPAWPAVSLALGLFGYHLWELRKPEVAFAPMWDLEWYFVCWVALAFRWFQEHVATGIRRGYDLVPDAIGVSPRRRAWALLLLACAVASGLAHYQTPLYTAFYLSRPQLDTLADRTAGPAAGMIMFPVFCGLFRIESSEVLGGGGVLLETRPRQFKGSYGFARLPGVAANVLDWRVVGTMSWELGTLQGGHRLSGDWFVLYSIYRRWE